MDPEAEAFGPRDVATALDIGVDREVALTPSRREGKPLERRLRGRQ
jgi:hypothetical protein